MIILLFLFLDDDEIHEEPPVICMFIIFESQIYDSYKMTKYVILLLTNILLDLKDDNDEDQALKTSTSSNVVGRFHYI
jgi:hypothetical protein